MALDGNKLRLIVIILYVLGLVSFIAAAFLVNQIIGFLTVGISLMLTVFILIRESEL